MVVLMQEFKTWMLFYSYFIDGGFGLWDTQEEGSSCWKLTFIQITPARLLWLESVELTISKHRVRKHIIHPN